MVYCSSCGAQMPDDAGFCPKCGAPAGSGADKNNDVYMDRHARHHLRREMRAEDRGWYRSPEYRLLQAVIAGLFIILLGGLMLMSAWEVTPLVTWANFWAYLLLGMGAILFVQYLLSFMTPGRAYHGFGALIGSIILMAVGVSGLSMYFFNWARPLWPLIIVGAGVLVIAVAIAAFLNKRAQ